LYKVKVLSSLPAVHASLQAIYVSPDHKGRPYGVVCIGISGIPDRLQVIAKMKFIKGNGLKNRRHIMLCSSGYQVFGCKWMLEIDRAPFRWFTNGSDLFNSFRVQKKMTAQNLQVVVIHGGIAIHGGYDPIREVDTIKPADCFIHEDLPGQAHTGFFYSERMIQHGMEIDGRVGMSFDPGSGAFESLLVLLKDLRG
jgi:hypothetical protein